jgi:hypothetical protein
LFHPFKAMKARKAKEDADVVAEAAHLLSQRAQAVREARATLKQRATINGLLLSVSDDQRARFERRVAEVLSMRGSA